MSDTDPRSPQPVAVVNHQQVVPTQQTLPGQQTLPTQQPPYASMGQPIPAQIMPARLRGQCGCGAHQGEPCPTCVPGEPNGYVMWSPQGYNAYGIDPQEFLCDGGDRGSNAAVRHDNSIAGLELEDTVVHYTTDDGNVHLHPSNRTCVYAPRFTSVRQVTGALAGGRAIGLRGVDRPVGPNRVEHDLPGLLMTDSVELGHAEVARRTDAFRERNRSVPVDAVQQVEESDDVLAAMSTLKLIDLRQADRTDILMIQELALAAVTWSADDCLEVTIADVKPPSLTRDQTLRGFTIYEYPDAGRLRIAKLADRSDALPGETVKFSIRIDNVGDSAVRNVVIADNLTTRLQYVEGSQSCDGAKTEFSTQANSGQSAKLQWKITDELQVGDTVTVHFECLVR